MTTTTQVNMRHTHTHNNGAALRCVRLCVRSAYIDPRIIRYYERTLGRMCVHDFCLPTTSKCVDLLCVALCCCCCCCDCCCRCFFFLCFAFHFFPYWAHTFCFVRFMCVIHLHNTCMKHAFDFINQGAWLNDAKSTFWYAFGVWQTLFWIDLTWHVSP